VPSLRIGKNQGRVAWTATTKILAMRVDRALLASSTRGLDRLAGKARRRNTAHKVCRRFLKRPGTRVSRLLSSPTQRTLIARLKIRIKCRRARERIAFLASLCHWVRSSRAFLPLVPRFRDRKALYQATLVIFIYQSFLRLAPLLASAAHGTRLRAAHRLTLRSRRLGLSPTRLHRDRRPRNVVQSCSASPPRLSPGPFRATRRPRRQVLVPPSRRQILGRSTGREGECGTLLAGSRSLKEGQRRCSHGF
jgi:hypothetical protein